MTKYAFAINLHRCIGCRTCTVSCKMENHVADNICRIPVYNDSGSTEGSLDAPSGSYPNITFLWRPTPCQHCDNAPCVEVCPTGATTKREDGVVVIDKETCIGCKTCMNACPYNARSFDESAQVVDKCEMCIHRLSNGEEKTICQLCCPNRAITVGDLDDSSSEISKIVAQHDCEQLFADKGTGPNVYYWRSVS